jgi:hypothetical protein
VRHRAAGVAGRAIAVHGHSTRSAEAARLADFASAQAAGPTRDELIAKGLIYAPRRGTVAFTVPQFDRFIRDATDHELPASGRDQQLELAGRVQRVQPFPRVALVDARALGQLVAGRGSLRRQFADSPSWSPIRV